MKVKKFFLRFVRRDHHYTPLYTAFGSARTTPKYLTLVLYIAHVRVWLRQARQNLAFGELCLAVCHGEMVYLPLFLDEWNNSAGKTSFVK